MAITEIVARSDGELFVFVNDAIVMVPRWFHHFYDNNHGSETITVQPLED